MPVQWVNRPNLDFRGFAGTIAGGRVAARRSACASLPSGRDEPRSRASSPTTAICEEAVAGPVRDPDADRRDRRQRGDMLARAEPARRGRRPVRGHDRLDGRGADAAAAAAICIKIGTAHRHRARSRRSSTRSTSNTLEHLAAHEARAQRDRRVRTSSSTGPIAFDPYTENRDTGGFILIDRLTNDTVGAGHAALRPAPRAATSTGRPLDVDKAARAR